MKTIQPRPVLIFLHLPKTGGSTLARVLRNQYGAEASLTLYASTFDEELKAIPREQLEETRLITGHFYFGVHSLLPGPSAYLTMLRNPIDRIISHYYFVKEHRDHYLFEPTQGLSLQEYVRLCGRLEPNNDQTRLLAGLGQVSESGECSPEMLPGAKQNLRDYFSVVGITEEFDRSLFLMKRVFVWKTPFYAKQNVARHRPRNEEISHETLQVIRAYNQLDLELYRYAKELFQKQLQAQGNSLEKELRLFRVLNRSFNQVYRLAASAAGRLGVTST